jgi:hypothetical protein
MRSTHPQGRRPTTHRTNSTSPTPERAIKNGINSSRKGSSLAATHTNRNGEGRGLFFEKLFDELLGLAHRAQA